MASPFQLVFWQALLAAVVLGVAGLAVDGPPQVEWDAGLVAGLGYAGIVGTALGYWAMTAVNRRLPAVTTSLGVSATPLVGIGSAAVLLGEPVTIGLLLAVSLVTAGLALGARG